MTELRPVYIFQRLRGERRNLLRRWLCWLVSHRWSVSCESHSIWVPTLLICRRCGQRAAMNPDIPQEADDDRT